MTSLCGCWLRSRPDSLGFCPSDRSPHDRACNARPRAWRVRSDLKRKGVTMSRMSVNHIAVLLAIGAIVPMQSFVSRARQVFPAASNTIADIRDSPMAASSSPPWLQAYRSLIGRARSYGNTTRWVLTSLIKPQLSKSAWTESKFCFISTATMTSRWPLSTLARGHLIYLQRSAQSSSPPALRDFQSRIGEIAESRKLKENFLQSKGTKSPAALPLHTTLAVSGLEATGAFATSMPQAL